MTGEGTDNGKKPERPPESPTQVAEPIVETQSEELPTEEAPVFAEAPAPEAEVIEPAPEEIEAAA